MQPFNFFNLLFPIWHQQLPAPPILPIWQTLCALQIFVLYYCQIHLCHVRDQLEPWTEQSDATCVTLDMSAMAWNFLQKS